MESMSVGTPVIAARMGSIADVVEDGQSGLLFEPGDVTQLVTAITRIGGDPGFSSRLASNGRARVEARFDEALSVATLRRELELLRADAATGEGLSGYSSSAA
jgi:glycosyltransferase involved in cell wall biosynthesis